MHSSLPLSLSVKTFHQKQTGDLQSSGLGPSGTTICNHQLIMSFPSLHYSLWLFSQALISAATLRNKASRKNPVALLTTISVLPNLSFLSHHRNRYEDFPNSPPSPPHITESVTHCECLGWMKTQIWRTKPSSLLPLEFQDFLDLLKTNEEATRYAFPYSSSSFPSTHIKEITWHRHKTRSTRSHSRQ